MPIFKTILSKAATKAATIRNGQAEFPSDVARDCPDE